jgi:hypothetical protein
MGRVDPRKRKLSPSNWKDTLKEDIEKKFSDINSSETKKRYLQTLNHDSAEDAVKRMTAAGYAFGHNGLRESILWDTLSECCKVTVPRCGPLPEEILKKDIADLKRIQAKVKRMIAAQVDPEHFGTFGRDLTFPRRTFTNEQILECLSMTEATLQWARSVRGKKGPGRPAHERKLELAKNLEILFRRVYGNPVHGAIGDWIKAAFNDKTKWPADRVKKLLTNKGG